MRGEQYLTRQAQFEAVYEKSNSWTTRLVVLRARPNGLDFSRYGFTVSRRVGKAVVRNRIKRLFREILRQTPLQPGWDIIFIARVSSAGTGYLSLENSVRELLHRARLLVGKDERVSPGTN